MNHNPLLLIDRMWSPAKNNNALRYIVFFVTGIAALTLSAKIKFHFDLIAPPFTMQTAVILLLSAAMGWRLGMSVILGYLLLGMMGWPVFADTPEKGIGLAYMVGPTGGYLFGFLVASLIVGYAAERGLFRHKWAVLPLLFVGAMSILAFGFLYLGALLGSYASAWTLGVSPFLFIEAIKAVLVMAILFSFDLLKTS